MDRAFDSWVQVDRINKMNLTVAGSQFAYGVTHLPEGSTKTLPSMRRDQHEPGTINQLRQTAFLPVKRPGHDLKKRIDDRVTRHVNFRGIAAFAQQTFPCPRRGSKKRVGHSVREPSIHLFRERAELISRA